MHEKINFMKGQNGGQSKYCVDLIFVELIFMMLAKTRKK